MNLVKMLFWTVEACTLYGGGKGSAAPPPPDYTGAAVAQSDASKEIATSQTAANRPNLYTPWGSQTWSSSAGTDPATGQAITNWSSNINLSPDQQAANDAQMRIQSGRSGAAEQLLGQATGAFGTPFDWNNLPNAPGNLGDAQKSAYQLMSEMQEPGRTKQTASLDTKLANMGLGYGSEAAKNARFDQQQGFAQEDKSMMAQALAEGRGDVGTQQQLRQAAIAEEAQRRGMPLNELNALLTGQQVNMPQMPNFQSASAGQAPQLLNAAIAGGNYGMDAAKLNQSSGPDFGSMIGGAASLAGAFM